MDDGSFDFSFSGLKSAVKRVIDLRGGSSTLSEEDHREIAAEFQHTVVTSLIKKTLAAVEHYNVSCVVLAG